LKEKKLLGPCRDSNPDRSARSKMSNESGMARSWPNLRYIPAYVYRVALLQKGRKNLQYNASNKYFVGVERLKYLTKAVCNQNSFKISWIGIRSETGQTGGLRSSVFPSDT
jgi:hypothetical protein